MLNVFDGYKFSNYWFQTGTPTFLVELFKKSDYDLRVLLDGIEAPASSFIEYRVAANNPVPLIYQSGYLTIKGYDEELSPYPPGLSPSFFVVVLAQVADDNAFGCAGMDEVPVLEEYAHVG